MKILVRKEIPTSVRFCPYRELPPITRRSTSIRFFPLASALAIPLLPSRIFRSPSPPRRGLWIKNKVKVGFQVKHTGAVEGAEVAQVYVSDPSAKVERPERELKDFEKVRLKAGEAKHISIELDSRAFSYYDTATHQWKIDPSQFRILVGILRRTRRFPRRSLFNRSIEQLCWTKKRILEESPGYLFGYVSRLLLEGFFLHG